MQLLSALVLLGSITVTVATDTPSLKTLFDELRKKNKPVARPKEASHTALREAGKPGVKLAEEYCSEGCPTSWIGDNICDESCNVPQCSFDNGDCGKFPEGDCITESCDWNLPLSKLSQIKDMVTFSCQNDLMDEQFRYSIFT